MANDSGQPVSVFQGGHVMVVNADGSINVVDGGVVASSAWAVQHNPIANTKATITKAAGAGSVRNICTGFTVSLAAGAAAPAAVQLTVALIDGASGGGTYLWGPTVISLPAIAGAISAFAFGNRHDVGSAATAMTLEFSAAGGANTIESVSMNGTTA